MKRYVGADFILEAREDALHINTNRVDGDEGEDFKWSELEEIGVYCNLFDEPKVFIETIEPDLCPICGKRITVTDIGGDYFIFCECGIEFAPDNITDREGLIKAWNKRTQQYKNVCWEIKGNEE
jgi:hypothetical protein